MNRSKREEAARAALVMSGRWTTAVESYSIKACIAVGPVDMSSLDDDDLNAIGIWAMAEDLPTPPPPVPLMVYLGQLQRAHEANEV